MRLREISFTSTRQLVEFTNYRKLMPQQIQEILSEVHSNKTLKLTLLFWDDAKHIPPLEEVSPVLREGREAGLAYVQSSKKVAERSREEANVAYSKTYFSSIDIESPPEEMENFLDRKDKEREHVESIKSVAEMKREAARGEISNEECRALWNDVEKIWQERYEGIEFPIAFKNLTFEGSTIYAPTYCFGLNPEGAVFYNLALIVEEVFGNDVSLEYS